MISDECPKGSDEWHGGEREDEGGTSYGPEGRGYSPDESIEKLDATDLAARHRYDLFGAAAKHDVNRPVGPFEKSVR